MDGAQHFTRNVSQPLNLVINFYSANHKAENAESKGGVYPEVQIPKREIRPSKCHFKGSIYENGEEVRISIMRWSNVGSYMDRLGGSPGLVVMTGDSCSKDCEFESQHRILEGPFFTLWSDWWDKRGSGNNCLIVAE